MQFCFTAQHRLPTFQENKFGVQHILDGASYQVRDPMPDAPLHPPLTEVVFSKWSRDISKPHILARSASFTKVGWMIIKIFVVKAT